jgi:hypothetical protein
VKPTVFFKYPAKVSFLLFAAIVLPLCLSAQSGKKPPPNPPPRPKNSTPATAQKSPQTPRTPAKTGTNPGATTQKPQTNTTTPRPQTNTSSTQSNGHGFIAPSKGAAPIVPAEPPRVVNHPGGGKTVTTAAGHSLEYNKSGQLNKVVTRSGAEAHFDSRGKVTIKSANGTVITHSPGGGRRLVTEHRDTNNHLPSRIVSTGPNRGYVERTFQRGGHEYMRRTYVYEGRTHVTVYRGYNYHGAVYYQYVPAHYYQPAFYGWASHPWPGPVYYTWGWNGAPYGYSFAPYPVYPSAAFWLTDYMITESLRAAYESQAAAGGAGNTNEVQASTAEQPVHNNSITLMPEVKQMIAEEVEAQLAVEQAAATQRSTSSTAPTSVPQQPSVNTDQVPPALDPSFQTFFVATNLDVTANGQACSLSTGDVLMRTENNPDKDNSISVSVISSKKSDCSMGSSVRVQVADLEDMHNHLSEQVDAGLEILTNNQGKKGLPAGPAANPSQNPEGQAAEDLSAASDLSKQQQDGDQAEKEVQQASPGNGQERLSRDNSGPAPHQ